MKIAIFGADGQLGRDVESAFRSFVIEPLPHRTVDITDADAVKRAIDRILPSWVVNAAGMTHVDRCESEEERAFAVNAEGARNVAAACADVGARLIHISTDYVFDGAKRTPYIETDEPKPLNIYGRSKLAGEQFVAKILPSHYIVRSSGLYGTHPCRGKGGSNFVDTMLRLAAKNAQLRVVADEVLTPTYTRDLVATLVRLATGEPPFGIYHATNEGECSWFEFAGEIFRVADVKVELEKTTAAEWKAAARRPAYSVLDNAALRRDGIDAMPHWKDALGRYLASKKP